MKNKRKFPLKDPDGSKKFEIIIGITAFMIIIYRFSLGYYLGI